MEKALGESLIGDVGDANGELVGDRFSLWQWCVWRKRRLRRVLLVRASAAKGSADGVWAGRVEP